MGCAKSQPAVTTAPAPAHGPADALADAGSPNSLHDEYALHGRLGHGSFGCVIAASPRSPEAAGDEVAVKVVSLATDPGEGKRAAEEMLHSDRRSCGRGLAASGEVHAAADPTSDRPQTGPGTGRVTPHRLHTRPKSPGTSQGF